MAGGNYGGSSIPTTPIGGAALLAGKNTTYKNYKCTTAVGGTNFIYDGVTITTSSNVPIELVMSPPNITSQSGGVTFLCYSCSCSGVMSGSTAPWSGMTNPSGPFWNPVILGGNGLNS